MLQLKDIKPKIKKRITQVLLHGGHRQQGVSTKLLSQTMVHVGGYAKALEQFGQQPLPVDEVEEQIIKVGIDYILEQLGIKDEQET